MNICNNSYADRPRPGEELEPVLKGSWSYLSSGWKPHNKVTLSLPGLNLTRQLPCIVAGLHDPGHQAKVTAALCVTSIPNLAACECCQLHPRKHDLLTEDIIQLSQQEPGASGANMAPLSHSPTKETMAEARLGRKRLEKLAAPCEVRIRSCLRTSHRDTREHRGQPGHNWGRLSTKVTQYGLSTQTIT